MIDPFHLKLSSDEIFAEIHRQLAWTPLYLRSRESTLKILAVERCQARGLGSLVAFEYTQQIIAGSNADDMDTVDAYNMTGVPTTSTIYSSLLEMAGLKFKLSYPYLEAGDAHEEGWALYLSVVRWETRKLLDLVVPLIAGENIFFRIPADLEAAGMILDGEFGWDLLGKVVSVYPGRDRLISLAKELIGLTRGFRGPSIASATHLGSVLYSGYEGNICPDPGAPWPFDEIKKLPPAKRNSLLHERYKPVALLKPNVKGQVLKAIYFQGRFRIGTCLLKEGKDNMFSDMAGRDITDRLRWQFELHQKLEENLPVPRVIELFKENGSTWLAMDFIRGISLDQFISSVRDQRSWPTLPHEKKRSILEKLMEILCILEKLHERGIMHRDITPDNFLIDKRGKIYVIDLELASSLLESRPNPPFGLGTAGFMSPEQLNSQRPTVKEDVFGLGATMMAIFTALPPARFLSNPVEDLDEQLFYIIRDRSIVKLILSCIDPSPENRPGLPKIRTELEKLKMKGPEQKEKLTGISRGETSQLIESALLGLASELFLDGDLLWKSRPALENSAYGNPQKTYCRSADFYHGIPGIVHVIEQAAGLGYTVKSLNGAIGRAKEFIQQSGPKENAGFPVTHSRILPGKNMSVKKNSGIGLSGGAAGTALALIRAFKTTGQKKYRLRAERILQKLPAEIVIPDFTLASGIAGLGEVYLEAALIFSNDQWTERLNWILGLYKSTRQSAPGGGTYWITDNSGLQTAGLLDGQSGIIHFLLRYVHPGKLKLPF